jgi:membrane-bound lytic murein transglycosylase B
MRFFALFLAIITVFYNAYLCADQSFTKRQDVQNFINMMVKKHHFNRQDLIHTFNEVIIQPQIILSINKPYEQKPWDSYKQLFLTQQRLEEGLAFWKLNQHSLAKAEKIYGVPADIIVSIIGIETFYGKHQGNYRVLDALSTLAFNYPKRAPFFSQELAQYLLLCREHHIPAALYLGSYAGAMGKAQFMPSSYRHYATDFTNSHHKKDLMNDDSVVIASIANYIHLHGWQFNQMVAQPATVVATNQFKLINSANKTANYSINALAAAGIKPATAAAKQPTNVGLIKLITSKGVEYWLAYPNFYVITRYNTSPQYALAVYLLAQQLKGQWQAVSQK